MDNKNIKEQLITETKGSMFASLSFYLSAINDRFENMIAQTGVAAKSAEATYQLISSPAFAGSDIERYKLREAEMEAARPNVSAAASTAGKAIQRASLGILGLAAILPAILSGELRKKIGNFAEGFLEGLGIGKEARAKVLKGAKLVRDALLAYFSLTALKRVSDAINATVKLASAVAEALGIMDLFEKKRAAEDADMKKSARAIRRERARVRLEKRQLKNAGTIKKAWILAKRVLPKVVGKLVGAIPIVGTFAMIGIAMKDVFDEVTGFMDDQEEGPQTAEDVEAERDVIAEDRPAPSITYNPEDQSEAETRRLMRSAEEVKEQTAPPSSTGQKISEVINKVGESIGIKPPAANETGTATGGEVIDDSMQGLPSAATPPIIGARLEAPSGPGQQIEMASADVIGKKKQATSTNNYIIDNSVNNLIFA